mgnify:CR=1 FL=1
MHDTKSYLDLRPKVIQPNRKIDYGSRNEPFSYQWKIDNFDSLYHQLEDSCLKSELNSFNSEQFAFEGIGTFSMVLYPQGTTCEDEEHLAIFVHPEWPHDEDEFEIEMTILDKKGQKVNESSKS